jgi:phenylacetate-CoA ligase
MKGMAHLSTTPVSTFYSLWRHPHVDPERIREFRNHRLRRVIHHAYHNVLYYRTLFERHGLKPEHIRTVEDLPRIPMTSRAQLQALPEEHIVARGLNARRLIWRDTSGSSGISLRIRRTWLEERLHGMLRLRALHSQGLRVGDTHCYVVMPLGRHRRDHQILQRIAAAVGFGRQMVVNCLLSPEEIVGRLEAIAPAAVTGYPAVLASMTQAIATERLRALRLRFVGTGGEVLTPLMRQQIQEAFGAPVYDMYASHEFNLVAWQCRASGEFHVCDDGVTIEVLNGDRPVEEGQSGEVVGTDLHSAAMPLIRYRLGDVVTKGASRCRCGQPFSTIQNVRGRMIDYFHLPDGRKVHPFQLWGARREKTHWIRQYQVTQEGLDHIVLRVVPWHMPSARELAALRDPAAAFLGPRVRFEVELVPEIRVEPNGKFRVFRSRVASYYDETAPSLHGTAS